MDNPSSQSFDTTKIFQLITFICDEGYSIGFALDAAKQIIAYNDDDLFTYKPVRKFRIVWAIIKCGINYRKGKFYIDYLNYPEAFDLDTILIAIFGAVNIKCGGY